MPSPNENTSLVGNFEIRLLTCFFQIGSAHPFVGVAEFRQVKADCLIKEPFNPEMIDGLCTGCLVHVNEGIHVGRPVIAHEEDIRGRGMARGEFR